MATNALEALGGTDPRRIEVNSEAYQARINPGSKIQIPQGSGGGLGQSKNSTQHHLTGWQRTEMAFQMAGGQFDRNDQTRWNSFSRGDRRFETRRQSIEIDNGFTPIAGNKPKNEPQMSGTEKLELAYRNAASFEERQRDNLSRMGRTRK